MRKLKYFSLIFLVCFLVFVSTLSANQMSVSAVEVANFNTSAKAMCVLEKDSGRVVAGKKQH